MKLPKIDLKGFTGTMKEAVVAGWAEHGSKIMLVGGIIGTGVALCMTADATLKAHDILEKEKKAQGVDNLPVKETFKKAAPCYIPAAVLWGVSALGIAGGYKAEANNAVATMAAYKLAESSLQEYKNATKEVVGDKKEQKIRQKVTENHMNTYSISDTQVYRAYGRGDSLFFEVYSGRYFRSDVDTIKKAVNDLNEELFNNGMVTLNEFYNALGLPETKLGDDYVFDAQKGTIKVDYMYSNAEDDSPCAEIEFESEPMFRRDCGYSY